MKQQGKEAFENYYRIIFEDDEYDAFITSLSEERLPILRFNPINEDRLRELWTLAGYEWKVLEWYPYALKWPIDVEKGTILPGYKEHLIYPMNASSLLPVIALDIQPNDKVLDACAAPGGKALMISELLGENGHLFANDVSRNRLQNMKVMFDNYGAKRFTIMNSKAETLQYRFNNSFTKILIDAPCSSEVHVYNNSDELTKWSPNRPKELHKRQVNLIKSLVPCLKSGGKLVYATCAITPEENEQVIDEILAMDLGLHLKPFDTEYIYPGEKGYNGKSAVIFDLSKVRRIFPHKHGLEPIVFAVFNKS